MPDEGMPGRLSGRVAIVTGASRGIGLAIARRLVADGARVCITARMPEALAEALAAFPAGTAIAVAGNAEDPAHQASTLDRVATEFGRADILANVAGMNPVLGPLLELETKAARKILEVNVLAALGWVQALWRHPGLGFADRGGCIVNLSSVTGRTPSPGIGFYGVSKAAVAHLTTTLAAELGPSVRVNAVAPAVITTEFSRALYEGREEEVSATYPLRRLGVPDDVAGAVAFLVSDDAAWITGQTITIDGGLLAAGGRA